MSDEIEAIIPEPASSTALAVAELASAVEKNVEAAKAPNTKRAYQGDWSRFEAWCSEHGVQPLPASPAAVAAYATWLGERGKKVSTIQRAVTAISQAHGLAEKPSPTSNERVRTVLKGIRRRLGTAQRKAKPLLPLDIRAAFAKMSDDIRGLRDRALVAVGFCGAFRRHELAALEVEDIEHSDDGLVITIRRSKGFPG